MVRLTMIIFAMAGTTLAGIGVVVILSANMGTAQNIIVAAALGAAFVLGDRQANRAVELPACARAHTQNVRMHRYEFDSHRGHTFML